MRERVRDEDLALPVLARYKQPELVRRPLPLIIDRERRVNDMLLPVEQ
ncbi:hypothetical protein [Flaviflexus ciconiae]|nr:hypothetical protein [Flaviflexus ciconiae]